ncbi:MAG: efflux RND transporter periplasmic adaptor subunit [Gammaproteobacteria bacterium]|jgi:RND family efflux transporter MFP subunit|nr:efflux RND transporter periplasmic adaptor subunit [Gammaproteobacteria bacterium]
MKARQMILPVAAVIGLGIAVLAVMQDRYVQQAPPPGVEGDSDSPASALHVPFTSHVAGTGVVEAGTGNIAIGTPVSGIVAAVSVKWGEHVEQGATLFRLDDRDLRAELPLAAARVQEADAHLARAQYQSKLTDQLHAQHVLSEEQYRDRHFEVQIYQAALVAAKAEVERIRVEIDRRIVRAPVAGRVLQINTRPGEFAESGVPATPLMVVGDDVRLRVRVDIDENDAGRVEPGAQAIAVVRGRPELRTDLHFESIEPYVAPKASLTGSTTERVDTRVLQVIYSFERAKLPVYIGQHLDVFIQAPPLGPPG